MTITASVRHLPITEEDGLYRELEITMQRLGHLVAFREKLNWSKHFGELQLGERDQLQRLKKTAAKNEGIPLFWARLSKNTLFQHLIFHPNTEGYYLPFRFSEPFVIEWKGKKIWFGSSVRLLEELGWLEMALNQQNDEKITSIWNAFKDSCIESNEQFSPFHLRYINGHDSGKD